MDPKGKTALITGGAHRVGKAITLALARAGANVVINYHSSGQAAQETVAEAQALGVDALAVQADVSDHRQVEAMVAAARERFGGVDILVNSASPWQTTPFPTQDLTGWRQVTDVLIHGSFYCANAVAPLMLAAGEGATTVRVNAVAPGPVLPPPDYDPERVENLARQTLLGRWGTPEDVAQAVLYLIQAPFVTGVVLPVDGGQRFGHRQRHHG